MVPLREADGTCGAKAVGLRRLLDAGLAVPDGLVIPHAGRDGWEHDLDGALRRLGPGPYAVRSSALAEDGVRTSYAGQLATFLPSAPTDAPADASPDAPTDIAAAVRRTARSGGTPSARAYAAAVGDPVPDVVPVIVQVMVEPDAAGVAFTRHPVTGADEVVVEAVRGRGDRLVGGTVTPERWTVRGDATVRQEASTEPVITADPAITAQQSVEVATAARRVEHLFGRPQDVEWAISSGTLWLLQARPITTAPPAGTRPSQPGEVLATGTPASPGVAAGPVRVVTGLDDFGTFDAGDVLVCRTTSPAWTPLLVRAAAVVTETGGILAHAAIVARELRIPAVVAVDRATTTLPAGRPVVVDGTAGSVSAGPRVAGA